MPNFTKTIACFLILLNLGCSEQTTEEPIVDWIAEHAVELQSVDPTSNQKDLEALEHMVGDAKIVSLGEPTHGNREVFQLKHRFIRYLVTNKGFNVFAMECPYAEALDINRYVVDGIGDPKKALAGIYYWTWDTEEVLDLIEWMRSYNANPDHTRKVKFYGFDPQDPQRAARVMLEYLEQVDPELYAMVVPELEILQTPFSDPIGVGRRQFIPEEYDSLSLKAIKTVMNAFDSRKDRYISISNEDQWEIAKQHARQIEFYIDSNINDAENYGTVRDLGQAKNIQWILNHEGEGTKILTWAHNIHINNGPTPRHPWMGYHLKNWYGEDLKIIGFFYNQGSFTALDEDMPSKGLREMTVGPAKEGSLEHIMIKAGLDMAILDLSEVPNQGIVKDWFNSPVPTRYSWGGYNENKPEDFYEPYTLAVNFDALAFIDSTSATIPIDQSDYDNIWLLDKILEAPSNLDFEESDIGETPKDWICWSKFKRLGTIMTTSDDAYTGEKSLMISRRKGLLYGEIAPNVVQSIDATPYRGKTIKLTAMSKTELVDMAYAFLHLKIEAGINDDVHTGDPPLYDSLDKIRIKGSEWTSYSIKAFVPEHASSITYSVHLRDFGKVWLDALSLEIID